MAQKIAKKKIHLPQDKVTSSEWAIMLLLAMGKDTLDVGLIAAAGIGFILNRITNFFLVGILWFWIFYRFQRFPTKKFIGTGIVEFIPLLGGLPMWTFLIIRLWFEKKTKTKTTKI